MFLATSGLHQSLGELVAVSLNGSNPGGERQPNGSSTSSRKMPLHIDLSEILKSNPKLATIGIAVAASVVTIEILIANIDKRFSEISSKLDDVKFLMQSERRSKLSGMIRYLRTEAVPTLLAGGVNQGLRQMLETNQQVVYEIEDQLLQELDHLLPVVKRTDSGFSLGSEAEFNEIASELNAFASVLDQLHLTLVSRLSLLQVLIASVPPDTENEVKMTRLSAFQDSLKALEPTKVGFAKLLACKAAFKSRINGLDSVWNKREMLATRRETLENHLESTIDGYTERHTHLTQEAHRLKAILQRIATGTLFYVQIQNGSPTLLA